MDLSRAHTQTRLTNQVTPSATHMGRREGEGKEDYVFRMDVIDKSTRVDVPKNSSLSGHPRTDLSIGRFLVELSAIDIYLFPISARFG